MHRLSYRGQADEVSNLIIQRYCYPMESLQRRHLWSSLAPDTNDTGLEHKNSTSFSQQQELSMPARQDATNNQNADPALSDFLGVPTGGIDASLWLEGEKIIQEAVDDQDFRLCFQILDRMAEEPDAGSKMNGNSIHLVVRQWLKCFEKQQKKGIQPKHHLDSPHDVWRKVEAYNRIGIPLDSRTCHRIIEATALIKSRKAHSTALAETILDRMLEFSKDDNPNARPSAQTFNAVIASWETAAANARPKSDMVVEVAPEHAMKLLEQLKVLYNAGWGEELLPNKHTYRGVMNLYARKGDGDRVEELLQELYESYLDHGNDALLPTTPFFTLVLYAWSKSDDPTAAERASTILERMLHMEATNAIPGLNVTPFCFNIVMICWSRQRTRESTEKTQEVFDQMLSLSKSDPLKTPNAGSYAALIQAWRWWDAKKAEESFWMWRREFNAGRCEMRMDNNLSSIILAWFNSKDPQRAKRCDKLLQYALSGDFGDSWSPTDQDFDITINAFCQERKLESTDRAEALLRQMDSVAQTGKYKGFDGPTANAYFLIVRSLTHLGKVERADALLRERFERLPLTEKVDKSNQHERLAGERRTVNSVVRGWQAKVKMMPEAADRAEDLLLSTEKWKVSPGIATFINVVECRKRARREKKGFGRLRGPSESRIPEVISYLDSEYQRGKILNAKDTYLSIRKDLRLMLVEK